MDFNQNGKRSFTPQEAKDLMASVNGIRRYMRDDYGNPFGLVVALPDTSVTRGYRIGWSAMSSSEPLSVSFSKDKALVSAVGRAAFLTPEVSIEKAARIKDQDLRDWVLDTIEYVEDIANRVYNEHD